MNTPFHLKDSTVDESFGDEGEGSSRPTRRGKKNKNVKRKREGVDTPESCVAVS